MKSLIIPIILITMLSSCAGTFRTIDLGRLPYSNKSTSGPLEVAYVYDIQRMSRNKRYAKKELKFNVSAVGISIKNNSDSSVYISKENFKTFSNDVEKIYTTPYLYSREVKQLVPFYLFHTLWGTARVTTTETTANGTTTTESSNPIWPLGAIGPLNMIIAASANAKNKEMMERSSIFGKTIPPKQTLKGVILIPSYNFEALSFKYSGQ